MAKKALPEGWRNRIVGEATVEPSTLVPNPANWRIHGSLQSDAMAGILNEVGWVQRILVNQRSGRVVDGHLRLKLALDRQESSIPVLYVDLSEAEESLILVTLDPLAALAETNKGVLAGLLQEIQSGDSAVQQMLSELADAEKLFAALPPPPLQTNGLPQEGPPEEEEGEAYVPSHVRMVQLFLTTDTFPLFQQYIQQLETVYDTDNTTDTVMECLRRACDSLNQ